MRIRTTASCQMPWTRKELPDLPAIALFILFLPQCSSFSLFSVQATPVPEHSYHILFSYPFRPPITISIKFFFIISVHYNTYEVTKTTEMITKDKWLNKLIQKSTTSVEKMLGLKVWSHSSLQRRLNMTWETAMLPEGASSPIWYFQNQTCLQLQLLKMKRLINIYT